jgi:hypothetical protein
MEINREWVNHIFREVTSLSPEPETVVVTPFGAYSGIDLDRLQTYSGIVQRLLDEIPIPKKGDGGLLLEDLTKTRTGKVWGNAQDAERLSILAKSLGFIDYGLPKWGRSLPVVFLEP